MSASRIIKIIKVITAMDGYCHRDTQHCRRMLLQRELVLVEVDLLVLRWPHFSDTMPNNHIAYAGRRPHGEQHATAYSQKDSTANDRRCECAPQIEGHPEKYGPDSAARNTYPSAQALDFAEMPAVHQHPPRSRPRVDGRCNSKTRSHDALHSLGSKQIGVHRDHQ